MTPVFDSRKPGIEPRQWHVDAWWKSYDLPVPDLGTQAYDCMVATYRSMRDDGQLCGHVVPKGKRKSVKSVMTGAT